LRLCSYLAEILKGEDCLGAPQQETPFASHSQAWSRLLPTAAPSRTRLPSNSFSARGSVPEICEPAQSRAWYAQQGRTHLAGVKKVPFADVDFARNKRTSLAFFKRANWRMKNEEVFICSAMIVAIATPAFADEVGVRAGPVGAGVTVGEPRDHDRDRERTVIKEREPRDSKTVIKKEDADGDRSKTVIHHDN
jgi:hypothetical protein